MIVAIADDALFFGRLILGFISWWYVWLGLVAIILVCVWLHGLRDAKKDKKRRAEFEKETAERYGERMRGKLNTKERKDK